MSASNLPTLPAHPGPARAPAAPTAAGTGPAWGKAVGLLLGWAALSQVPVHPAVTEWLQSMGVAGPHVTARAMAGIMALGVTPYLGAFVLVEVVAWVVPPWRRLRVDGRHVLERWAVRLSWTLATAQAFELARWVESGLWQHGFTYGFESSIPTEGRVLRAMVMTALLVGFGVTLWLVRRLGTLGLGHGITVWLAAKLVVDGVQLGQLLWADLLTGAAPARVLGTALLVVGVVAGAAFVLRHPERLSPMAGRVVRLPPSGVMPVVVASSLTMLPATLHNLDVAVPQALLEPNQVVAVVVVTAVMGLLFLRGPGSGSLTSWERWRAVGVGTVLLVAGTILYRRAAVLVGMEQPVALPAFSDVVLGAAAWLDVLANARAWKSRRDWTSVGSFQHVMRVDEVQRVLLDANIPTFATALYTRTALQWFGPYLPVDVLVPRELLAQARPLVEGAAAPAVAGGQTPPQG